MSEEIVIIEIQENQTIVEVDVVDTVIVEIDKPGQQGLRGVGIATIIRTSGDGSPGTTDTYTITYTDGVTTTFDIYNGDDGTDGIDGDDGRGIVSILRTSGDGSPGTTDTFTITYTDATTSTFDVYNGADGADGTFDPTVPVDYLAFSLTAGHTVTQGQLAWNDDEETLDLGQNGAVLQLGQEIHYHVRNSLGVQIDDGTPVMATGTIGASGRITIAPMDGTDPLNAKFFMGITTEDIPAGEDGKVSYFGKIRHINTTGALSFGGLETWNDGDILYVDPVNVGYLTNVEPSVPDLNLSVAIVINAQIAPSNGTIFVRATNLDTNAIGTLPTTTKGDLIVHDGSTNVRLPVGSDGLALVADAAEASGLKWAAVSGGGGLDSGDTLPVTATADDLFVHTLGSRDFLMKYDGAEWKPTFCLASNTVALYVDQVDGTDGQNYGSGTGVDAYNTLSYALSQLPRNGTGQAITISMSAGVHTDGNMFATVGNMEIRIVGVKTTEAGPFTPTSFGSGFITVTGAGWTIDEWVGYKVNQTGAYRKIISNTADTLYFAPTSDPNINNFTIISTTEINATSGMNLYGNNVYLYDISAISSGTGYVLQTDVPGTIYCLNCMFENTNPNGRVLKLTTSHDNIQLYSVSALNSGGTNNTNQVILNGPLFAINLDIQRDNAGHSVELMSISAPKNTATDLYQKNGGIYVNPGSHLSSSGSIIEDAFIGVNVDPGANSVDLSNFTFINCTTDVSGETIDQEAINKIVTMHQDILDPTGWVDNTAITVEYLPATRQIRLTGDLRYYWRGELKELTSPWTSGVHALLPDNGFFLYSTDGENFTWSTTPWEFSDLMAGYVFFGTSDQFGVVETHGTMPWQTHDKLHRRLGTEKVSGGTLSGYALASTTAADRRPTIDVTVLSDEDIETTLPADATETYTRATLTGAGGTTVFAKAQADIIPLSGNQPYWNEFTGGSWQQTLLSANQYMEAYLIGIPAMADTFSQPYRFIWIQGQAASLTLSTIRARTYNDLNLGTLENLSPEFTVLARVILRYTATNWQLTQVDILDGTREQLVGSPAGNYLSVVNTDATLTGNGTAVDPLSVVGGGGGGGDVYKVGTPVDNEIAVWTGDGTIEGDTDFTWDGTVLGINGGIQLSSATMNTIIERFGAGAATITTAMLLKARCTVDMLDGFGPGMIFAIEDTAAVQNTIGILSVRRNGADNSGKLSAYIYQDGAGSEVFTVDGNGNAVFTGNVNAGGDITANNLSGTNTGDQTDLTGITFTADELDAAVTDEDVLTTRNMVGWDTDGTHVLFTGDLDSIITNTEYYITAAGVTNEPAGWFGSGLLKTNMYPGGSSYGIQRIIDASTYAGKSFVRQRVFGSWTGWVETTATGINTGDQDLSGLVSTVGTPVDNQLAVWTGDGTLEGEEDITYDGSALSVAGNVVGHLAINPQTGTAYTPVLADDGKLITLSNAAAITFTVPPNSSVAYPVGTVLTLQQIGAGQVSVAEGAGVTVNSFDNVLDLAGQYATAVVVKTGTDTWELSGALDYIYTESNAIHDDVAGEIAAITEKAVPVSADLLIIEDSADSNNKKRVQVGNLPGGGGGFSDPMTTRGDLIYRDPANSTTRLPTGAANQVLRSDGIDTFWGAENFSIDGGTFADTYVNTADVNGGAF